MKKLIFAIIPFVLLTSCKVECPEDKTAELAAITAEYETKITKLENEKLHYCAALTEALSQGVIRYIGGNKFEVNGEIVEPMPFEELIEVCQGDIETYIEMVKSRVN